MIGVAFVLWAKYVPVTLKVPLTPKIFLNKINLLVLWIAKSHLFKGFFL